MTHLDSYTDNELLLKLHEEDSSKAFEAIYCRHFTPVFRFVYKVMQDRETAEDLVQNVFMGLWRKKDKRVIENLQAYLFGAAKNQIAKHFRRSKFNMVQLEYLYSLEGTLFTDEHILAMDTQTRIEAAVRQLPRKCRKVFELSRYGFLTNREISEKMGISIFTVENHIKKALFYLRQSLLFVTYLFMS